MRVARKSIRYNVIKNGTDFQGKVETEFETNRERCRKSLSKYQLKDNLHSTVPTNPKRIKNYF